MTGAVRKPTLLPSCRGDGTFLPPASVPKRLAAPHIPAAATGGQEDRAAPWARPSPLLPGHAHHAPGLLAHDTLSPSLRRLAFLLKGPATDAGESARGRETRGPRRPLPGE